MPEWKCHQPLTERDVRRGYFSLAGIDLAKNSVRTKVATLLAKFDLIYLTWNTWHKQARKILRSLAFQVTLMPKFAQITHTGTARRNRLF